MRDFVVVTYLDQSIFDLENEEKTPIAITGKRKFSDTTDYEQTKHTVFKMIAKEICNRRLFEAWHKIMHQTLITSINALLSNISTVEYSRDVVELIKLSKELREHLSNLISIFTRCDRLLHYDHLMQMYELMKSDLIRELADTKPIMIRCEMIVKRLNTQKSLLMDAHH